MQVIRRVSKIAAIADPELRQLIQQSADHLLSQFEPGEYSLEELAFYIVVEPQDSIADIDREIGRAILETTPELVVDHPGWYQLVVVLSDEGYGVEVFIPKAPAIHPELIAMCQRHGGET